MQTTQEVLQQFIAQEYRDTVRDTMIDSMSDNHYFSNSFMKTLLRGDSKLPCIQWWELVAAQAPPHIRAFAKAVMTVQRMPCSAASVERVNSCLGWLHSSKFQAGQPR